MSVCKLAGKCREGGKAKEVKATHASSQKVKSRQAVNQGVKTCRQGKEAGRK
jgi:hypothetical protein